MFTKNYYKALYGHMSFLADIEFVNILGVTKTVNASSIRYCTNLIQIGDTSNTYYARVDSFVKLPKTSTGYMWGVAFGDGSTPPSANDYALSGNHLTEYSASASIAKEKDSEGITIRCVYTITNTSAAPFTISEIGLYGTISNSSLIALVERTVLDSPITIPAGGVGQVTYIITMNYPT